ncbi:TPA: alpha/beta hydrolase [Pseudomonas aeruginosa]|nr:alpha/beta hydrolase [Pseudomonas aeruginosa]
MDMPARSPVDLKIALAILYINFATYNSHKRILSSSQLLLCWRKAPAGMFIDVLHDRVSGSRAKMVFTQLLQRVDELKLLTDVVEAKRLLSEGYASTLSTIRQPSFKAAVKLVISVPEDMVEYEELIAQDDYSIGASLSSERLPTHYSRAPVDQKFTKYAVYFGTDRLLESPRTVRFGGFRSDDVVSYGIAEVSIPHIHKEGKLEQPVLWPSTSKGNPNKHIVIHESALFELEEWYNNAKTYLAKISETSTGREGLLFIHGYNVTFDAALWRSAQLCHDLKFPGLMLCFSWASLGSTTGYPADEATVDWSAAHLKEYLTNVTENLGLTSLHIVAHSMGNRALLAVLENWENKPGATPISQIILAAPDVDAKRFKQFGRVFNLYEQVTLYASRNDRAITASQLVHSNPRAGGANPPLVMDHLSTIDVSSAGRDMFGLGHSYVADVTKVFRDLFYIVRHRHKPDQRAGITKKDEGHWELS